MIGYKTIFLLLSLAQFGLGVSTILDEEERLTSVLWSKKDGFSVVPKLVKNAVAWATFDNKLNSTGWGNLEVSTNKDYPDHVQAFAAGFAEGFLTADFLYLHQKNTVEPYCKGKEQMCELIRKYLGDNWVWVSKKIAHLRNKNPYWHQVGLFYDQYDGMKEGYEYIMNFVTPGHIPEVQILWMNMFGDLLDLEKAFAHTHNLTNTVPIGTSHCSALIKVLPNNADIYASHVSWYYYTAMIRMQKKYNFGYHWTATESKKLIPATSVSFSGYPGVIFSGDDFHILNSGLVTIETSLINANDKLYDLLTPHGVLLEGVRVTVANRLATNGKQWANIFSRRNGGTYNNQWMVLDYKKFTPGKPLPARGADARSYSY